MIQLTQIHKREIWRMTLQRWKNKRVSDINQLDTWSRSFRVWPVHVWVLKKWSIMMQENLAPLVSQDCRSMHEPGWCLCDPKHIQYFNYTICSTPPDSGNPDPSLDLSQLDSEQSPFQQPRSLFAGPWRLFSCLASLGDIQILPLVARVNIWC